MADRSPRTPSYRLHKASGQAVVTLGGQDVYLGVHGTDASKRAYDRAVAEWLASGRRARVDSSGLTVVELVDRYLDHVEGRYRSNEPELIAAALKVAREVYGETVAAEFGPLSLKVVRGRFMDADHVRGQINKRTRIVVRMFQWAVSEQLLPSATWEALRSVEGVPKGTKGVRESTKIKPVPDAFVAATTPYVSRQVRAMIELQRFTGARPGEVCMMRTCDLNTSGAVWEYRPSSHKTEHHDKTRVVFIGPAAQEVLKPWLRPVLTEYLFQPVEAEAERMAALRTARRSKVQPSQIDRSGPKPRKLGERYTPNSYRNAIIRGVRKLNAERKKKNADATKIPEWHPHQLRHSAATALRREFGLDTARAVLGHSSPAVTEVYAELDAEKARNAMKKMG